MALKVSNEQIERWKSGIAKMRESMSRYKEKADEVVQKAVTTVEIGGASFGMGVLMGKTGGISLLGIPVDLGAGLGLNILGFLGVGGKYVDHLHNLGNGSLAHYLGAVGYKVGKDWNKPKERQQIAAPAVSGALPSGRVGTGQADQDLADLIRASRT